MPIYWFLTPIFGGEGEIWRSCKFSALSFTFAWAFTIYFELSRPLWWILKFIWLTCLYSQVGLVRGGRRGLQGDWEFKGLWIGNQSLVWLAWIPHQPHKDRTLLHEHVADPFIVSSARDSSISVFVSVLLSYYCLYIPAEHRGDKLKLALITFSIIFMSMHMDKENYNSAKPVQNLGNSIQPN